jgi:hypothetical protein
VFSMSFSVDVCSNGPCANSQQRTGYARMQARPGFRFSISAQARGVDTRPGAGGH